MMYFNSQSLFRPEKEVSPVCFNRELQSGQTSKLFRITRLVAELLTFFN